MNEKTLQALLVLAETFGEPLSELRIEGYSLFLGDLPDNDLLGAIATAGRTCKFFPKPAELRELVTGVTEDRAEMAWAQVLGEVRRVGYTGQPTLDAAALDAVRSLWRSWEGMCLTLPGEGPELLGWRKAFISAYGASEWQTTRQQLDRGGELTKVSQLAPSVRRLLSDAAGNNTLAKTLDK
jgi:hypothetical protein